MGDEVNLDDTDLAILQCLADLWRRSSRKRLDAACSLRRLSEHFSLDQLGMQWRMRKLESLALVAGADSVDGYADPSYSITSDGISLLASQDGKLKQKALGEQALRVIAVQLDALDQIVNQARRDNDHVAGGERLDRWKARTVRLLSGWVSSREAQDFADKHVTVIFAGEPLSHLVRSCKLYREHLSALTEEIKLHGLESPLDKETQPVQFGRTIPEGRRLFIIHGHDELNLRRLKELLKEKWNISTIVMADQPGRSRPLIQKFEEEAEPASFAIALLTPDDMVTVQGEQYPQARPNVIFELGWFCGRLGRDRTCIVMKEGTRIHSDLDGISRITFRDDVRDKALDLEKELRAAGLR